MVSVPTVPRRAVWGNDCFRGLTIADLCSYGLISFYPTVAQDLGNCQGSSLLPPPCALASCLHLFNICALRPSLHSLGTCWNGCHQQTSPASLQDFLPGLPSITAGQTTFSRHAKDMMPLFIPPQWLCSAPGLGFYS